MRIKRIKQLITHSTQKEKKLYKLKTTANFGVVAGAVFAGIGTFLCDNYFAGVLAISGLGMAGYASLIVEQMLKRGENYTNFLRYADVDDAFWENQTENKELFHILHYVLQNVDTDDIQSRICKLNKNRTLHRVGNRFIFILNDKNELCHAYFDQRIDTQKMKAEIIQILIRNNAEFKKEHDKNLINLIDSAIQKNDLLAQEKEEQEETQEISLENDTIQDFSQLEQDILNMQEDHVDEKEIALAMRFLSTKFNQSQLELEKKKVVYP